MQFFLLLLLLLFLAFIKDNFIDILLYVIMPVVFIAILYFYYYNFPDVVLKRDQEKKKKIDARNALLEYNESMIRVAVSRHGSELQLRRHQLVTTDRYGITDETRWISELDHFIKHKLSHISIDDFDDVRAKIERMLDRNGSLLSGKRSTSNAAFLSPMAYEHFCAEILRESGWDARVRTH